MTPDLPLAPGSVVWVSLDPLKGREQGGHRPAVVVAGRDYLEIVDSLAIVVPVSTTFRGWPNHVPLSGTTAVEGWAMTEQVRTVTRSRISGVDGSVDAACWAAVRTWISDFLDLS